MYYSSREEQVTDELRKSTRGLNEDAGYVERYHELASHKPSGRRSSPGLRYLIEAMIGLVAIMVFTMGAASGYLQEAIVACFALGFLGTLVWGWRKINGLRRQDQLYHEAVERQNGIDRRFGRLGADRKK